MSIYRWIYHLGLEALAEVVAADEGEVVGAVSRTSRPSGSHRLSPRIMMDVQGLIYSSRYWARSLAPEQHVELAVA
jgi:hypothetical protein